MLHQTIPSVFFLAAISLVGPGEDSPPCEEATTTRQLVKCLQQELSAAQEELKGLNERVASVTTPEEQHLFDKAHAAWEAYLEANCQSASGLYAGGSMAGVVLVECKVRMTRNRISEVGKAFNNRFSGS